MEEEENSFYPIDLSIFKDHIKSSFLDILDRVRINIYNKNKTLQNILFFF